MSYKDWSTFMAYCKEAPCLVLTFPTVHQALTAEVILKEQNIKHELMPTPRAINTECGLCICIAAEDFNSVQALLKKSDVVTLFVYERDLAAVNFRLLPKE